jgi:hypothetical protein
MLEHAGTPSGFAEGRPGSGILYRTTSVGGVPAKRSVADFQRRSGLAISAVAHSVESKELPLQAKGRKIDAVGCADSAVRAVGKILIRLRTITRV